MKATQDQERQTEPKLVSLRRQLAEAEENVRLIEEREAEFVMETSIPLDLVKEKRQTQRRVEELKRRIKELE